jgi:MFS family permease
MNGQLPGPIRALVICQLVSRAGNFLQPFLVLYLTQDRHLSAATAGAVTAAAGAGTVASQLLGGWMSDRIGRRHTMLIGFVTTAIGLIALGSADSMTAIWISAFAVGLVSNLFRPAASAVIADLLGPRERVRAYGLQFWAANLGFSVSTVSAGVLAGHGYGLLFWLNAATSLAAALVVWHWVPETRPVLVGTARRAMLPVVARDHLLIGMVVIFVVYGSLYVQAFSTLPLAMARNGLGSTAYGILMGLNGLVIVAVQPLASRFLAGRDHSTVLATSMLVVGLGFGLGAVVHGTAGYTVSVVIWTLGEIGVAAIFGAVFADLAPEDMRGAYLGIAGTTWGLGSIFGPILGTAALQHSGPAALWLGCALTGVVLFVAQLAVAPSLRRRASYAAPTTVPA